jgi:hypothetical protein
MAGHGWLRPAHGSVRRLRTPVLAYVGIVPTLPYRRLNQFDEKSEHKKQGLHYPVQDVRVIGMRS